VVSRWVKQGFTHSGHFCVAGDGRRSERVGWRQGAWAKGAGGRQDNWGEGTDRIDKKDSHIRLSLRLYSFFHLNAEQLRCACI
jgi:hypothetical protein